MKQNYKDFLVKFTSTGDYPEPVIQFHDRGMVNNFLKDVSSKELAAYVSKTNDRWLVGFPFFDGCINFVELSNKKKFLEFTWVMFADQDGDTKPNAFHPWKGQFNPLDGEERDSKSSEWFREGAIRFELDETLSALEWTYKYGWWSSIEHFLNELCMFQTNDFVVAALSELAKKMNKKDGLVLPVEKGNFETLEVFKNWARDDLKLFDGDDIDWLFNSP